MDGLQVMMSLGEYVSKIHLSTYAIDSETFFCHSGIYTFLWRVNFGKLSIVEWNTGME